MAVANNNDSKRVHAKDSHGSELLQPMKENRRDANAGSRRGSGSRRLVKDAVRYKTILCANWSSTGKCPYGFKCQFAHGPEELRLRSEPMRSEPAEAPDKPAASSSGAGSSVPTRPEAASPDRLLWAAIVSQSTPRSPRSPPTPPTQPTTPTAPATAPLGLPRAIPPQPSPLRQLAQFSPAALLEPPGLLPVPPLALPSPVKLPTCLPCEAQSALPSPLPLSLLPTPLPAPAAGSPASAILPAAHLTLEAIAASALGASALGPATELPHALDAPARQYLGGPPPFSVSPTARLPAAHLVQAAAPSPSGLQLPPHQPPHQLPAHQQPPHQQPPHQLSALKSSEHLPFASDAFDLNRLSLEPSDASMDRLSIDSSDRFEDDAFDDEASLRCNALTGEVEVDLPMGRQLSHNTASIRRQISMIFE